MDAIRQVKSNDNEPQTPEEAMKKALSLVGDIGSAIAPALESPGEERIFFLAMVGQYVEKFGDAAMRKASADAGYPIGDHEEFDAWTRPR